MNARTLGGLYTQPKGAHVPTRTGTYINATGCALCVVTWPPM